MGQQTHNILLISGPTASGKSQLALEIARKQFPSVIINADSMQVYADLHILTARPSQDEIDQVPHKLYGFVDGARSFSVGQWLDTARDALNQAQLEQKNVIFVGGTGLYFRALGGGLAEMPEIPHPIRNFWREKLENEGAASLYRELTVRDPLMAQKLRPTDGQRLIRALEILEATGKSLGGWQAQKSPPLIDLAQAKKILIIPDRQTLYERINHRFERMLELGALDEVQALLARGLGLHLPVMKAIGVRELAAFLRGEIGRDEALQLASRETRRYAKRQISWFRNQMKDENWQIFSNEQEISAIFN